MLKMRLKLVATADFRMGVPTHVAELRKQRKFDLGNDEVILLISQTGLQLAFVFSDTHLRHHRDDSDIEVLTHVRVQLNRHTPWHPRMLVNYAREAGIELVGHRAFEEWYREEHGAVPVLPDEKPKKRHLTAA